MSDDDLEKLKREEEVLYSEFTKIDKEHKKRGEAWMAVYRAIDREVAARKLRAELIAEVRAEVKIDIEKGKA